MALDRNKTLEGIDGQSREIPPQTTPLVATCHKLLKKPLGNFTVEDLRIMISQNYNLDILVPLAIDQLRNNILAEGDLYEGDLLHALLTTEPAYWKNQKQQWTMLRDLYLTHEETFRRI